MQNKRLEKIKSARSLNDILSVISDIEFEFRNSKVVVDKLVASLSTEIQIDHRDGSRKTRKVVKDEKFVAPNVKTLQKHVGVLTKLYDNTLELDAAEAMIKQAYAGNKKQPAALAAVKALRIDVENSIDDAFAALSEIGTKHLPTEMQTLVDKITANIVKTVSPDSYKDIKRLVYVVPDPAEANMFQFCEYIGLEELQNSEGFKYDMYYIVVTGVINNEGEATYYVNSLPDFKIPGKYPKGAAVENVREAEKRVALLLAHNNFILALDKLPLPLDTQRAKNTGITNIKGVVSATVKNDELTVLLDPSITTHAAVQKIVLELLARLNGVVGARKGSKAFIYKEGTIKGAKAIRFALVPDVENVKAARPINVARLNEVAEILSLNDKQRDALRFALQS